jgi:hypothetical protein
VDCEKDARRQDRHTVLEVFGLELKVSNPRLAELLTMDAKQALTTDLRDLASPERVAEAEAEAAEAAPDVVLAPHLPHDEEDARHRQAFREEVRVVGSQLGFSAGSDGLWRSPQGITILTRAISRPLSFAGASHYVQELAARRESIAGADSTALFIVESQETADVFKVAVRQQRLHDTMRTISIANLNEVRDLVASGRLGHKQAVVLLVPLAGIDVGEVMSILRSSPESSDEPAA